MGLGQGGGHSITPDSLQEGLRVTKPKLNTPDDILALLPDNKISEGAGSVQAIHFQEGLEEGRAGILFPTVHSRNTQAYFPVSPQVLHSTGYGRCLLKGLAYHSLARFA